MSMTLRSAATNFFGMPPIFRRKEAEVRVQRPVARQAATRIEPSVRAAPAPQADKVGTVDFDKLLAATRKAPVDLAPI